LHKNITVIAAIALLITKNLSIIIKIKVKQSRYRPGVAQRVPGS